VPASPFGAPSIPLRRNAKYGVPYNLVPEAVQDVRTKLAIPERA